MNGQRWFLRLLHAYRGIERRAEARGVLRVRWLDEGVSTVKYACRSLLRAPASALSTVLVLSIGIAGMTAMMALVYGVLLRPLPVPQQDRLVVVWKALRSSGFAHYPFGAADIRRVAESTRPFEQVAGVGRAGASPVAVVESGVARYANDAWVTGGFFDVLGIRPVRGRMLTRDDDLDGAEPVVVIGRGLWQRWYGGSPEAIGRQITIGHRSFRVVGIVPSDLDYPRGADLWRTPASVDGLFRDAARSEVDLVGRLRPGVTIEQATAQLTALVRRLELERPAGAPRGLVPVVHTLEQQVVGDVGPVMTSLFLTVALVLFIAIANGANLLLMRNEARRSEFAVRLALGAGRGRIAAQILAEGVTLTLIAGAAGLAVVWMSLPKLLALVPDGLPRVESVRMDPIVVLFAVGLALATAVLTGVAPILSVGADLVPTLRAGGRGVIGSRSRRLRRGFVVAQVALAVTAMAAAGLLTRTLLRLQAVDTGVAADHLVFATLSVPNAEQADRPRYEAFLRATITRLESLPSIAAATPINNPPYSGGWDVPQVSAQGQTPERAAANPSLNLESVFPNYFRALGVPLLRGRAFTDADRQGTPAVAIVSDDVAARVWPGEDPIGKRLQMGRPGSRDPWLTVVGVAGATRYRELTTPVPTLYLPATQFLMTAQVFAIRTTASAHQVASMARDELQALNRSVQVTRVMPFVDIMARPLARPRFNAVLSDVFGLVAVLLASVGLYAVMGTYVRQRDRDIALRVVLGATATDVRRLVLGEALALAAVGAGIGLAGAVGAARLVRSTLYQVSPLDPVAILGSALVLLAASALATYLPARRAVRADPVALLRLE